MAIQYVGKDDVEQFTLQTNPRRTFISSSTDGVTGSVSLFARSSKIEKELNTLSTFSGSVFNDNNIEQILATAVNKGTSDISSEMAAYLSSVNASVRSIAKQTTRQITRFEPSTKFTSDTGKKNIVKNLLFPYYRDIQPSSHWAYTNYHTLNFFTASSVPTDSVLLYPNSSSASSNSAASGSYMLDGAFTFEFYINPRYTTDKQFDEYPAGTLFHLSSSYAVSIVSGSGRDSTNRVSSYRILLQVSGGADTSPSSIDLSALPDQTYLSDEHSLKRNHWHHVGIRWAENTNSRTGSFVIDGLEKGTFVFPSATIAPAPFSAGNPDVLCVGNFYEGNNSGNSNQALFFNQNIRKREGLVQLIDNGNAATDGPQAYTFSHPLNAEVHELKIHNTYRTSEQLQYSAHTGSTETGSIIFYVPPFFTKGSPTRSPQGTSVAGAVRGGILQTPFIAISGTTDTPFNTAYSFGLAGHLLNLENFTKDLITSNFPRLLNLSGTQITGPTQALSANQFTYATGSLRKRNVTVLPNDNGLFIPDFSLLASGASDVCPQSGCAHDKYVNDLGNLDYSLITLNNMIPTSTLFDGLIFDSGSFFETMAGANPEAVGIAPGAVHTVYQRTRDNSSNEVVFFDISNILYGNKIDPGTFIATDSNITGTNGKVSITIRDNSNGGLYRADSKTKHATWNNIGNIFYNEGLAVVKTPNIPFFGKDKYEISLAGEQNIHMMRIHVPARAGEFNSSSNPSYIPVSASNLAHETDAKFVYITGLNFHDDNLNVIMKTRFAQPIIKRDSDKLLFRTKVDF